MKKYNEDEQAAFLRYFSKYGCPVQAEHGLEVPPLGLCIEQLPNAGTNILLDLVMDERHTSCKCI